MSKRAETIGDFTVYFIDGSQLNLEDVAFLSSEDETKAIFVNHEFEKVCVVPFHSVKYISKR